MKKIMVDPNRKELTQHRTVELPIACYNTTIAQHANGYIPLHWHEEIQFIRMVKGEASFQVNDERVVVSEGDGLFINSGSLHKAEAHNVASCTYICINVSPHFVLPQELFTTYVAPYIQATNLPYLYIDAKNYWGTNVLQAIMKINECIQQQSSHYEIDIALQLTVLWKSLIMNGFQLQYDQAEMVKNHRMKEMLNWIHKHYDEKIMLDDIARAGQLSRSECCRYFNRMLQTTPLKYVMHYRIQQSLLLLRQEQWNVTEVAYQVGFTSPSYFIEKFRETMNMTPFAYKKETVD